MNLDFSESHEKIFIGENSFELAEFIFNDGWPTANDVTIFKFVDCAIVYRHASGKLTEKLRFKIRQQPQYKNKIKTGKIEVAFGRRLGDYSDKIIADDYLNDEEIIKFAKDRIFKYAADQLNPRVYANYISPPHTDEHWAAARAKGSLLLTEY